MRVCKRCKLNTHGIRLVGAVPWRVLRNWHTSLRPMSFALRGRSDYLYLPGGRAVRRERGKAASKDCGREGKAIRSHQLYEEGEWD